MCDFQIELPIIILPRVQHVATKIPLRVSVIKSLCYMYVFSSCGLRQMQPGSDGGWLPETPGVGERAE